MVLGSVGSPFSCAGSPSAKCSVHPMICYYASSSGRGCSTRGPTASQSENALVTRVGLDTTGTETTWLMGGLVREGHSH